MYFQDILFITLAISLSIVSCAPIDPSSDSAPIEASALEMTEHVVITTEGLAEEVKEGLAIEEEAKEFRLQVLLLQKQLSGRENRGFKLRE
jgi:hypothetical protein